jgi:nucleolar protein 58
MHPSHTNTHRIKLKAFKPFENTAEAVAAATDVIESNLGKDLKKFLKKSLKDQDLQDRLAVADTKLGALIKEKLGLDIATGEVVGELFRGVRQQLDALLTGMSESNLKAMQLGLSHSLSRYKLKFSADKVDTMIVQAIGLLDELDKEINTYAMRVREWCVRACLPACVLGVDVLAWGLGGWHWDFGFWGYCMAWEDDVG